MILEGILTTTNEDGSMHVAPMGPDVDRDRVRWTLKPFKTSTTYANLRRTQQAIFHVVDDSLLLAHAVLGQANQAPAQAISPFGFALQQACEWFALEVFDWDESTQRAVATAHLRFHQSQRPFFGWNRAKHAIVEAAILVSRCHWLEPEIIDEQWKQLAIMVDKTSGDQEQAAFELLANHLRKVLQERIDAEAS